MAHYYGHGHDQRLVVAAAPTTKKAPSSRLAAAQLHDGCRLVAHCPFSVRAVLYDFILTLAATTDWPELGRMPKQWPLRLAGRIDCLRVVRAFSI
jgi:hypothetical protein